MMRGLQLVLLLVTCSLSMEMCEGAIEYGAKPFSLNEQGHCPSLQERERVIAEISADARVILSGSISSCNGSPGWRRVGFVNMTDPSQDCPPGLNLTSHSIRSCGSSHHTRHDCSSTTFSVSGQVYSQVCGRIKAYQSRGTSSFNQYIVAGRSIEQSYVDGVSLTHGAAGDRKHIWTFVAGLAEEESFNISSFLCPCDSADTTLPHSPPFVGNNYFCETANNNNTYPLHIFYGSDPLWDGEGCGSTSTCCQFNNPPWFTKTLPIPTTDDIELRLCHGFEVSTTDVPIELIELYIKSS